LQDGFLDSSKHQTDVACVGGLRKTIPPLASEWAHGVEVDLLRIEVKMGAIDLIKPP
jgi:hypothetical protein